jgi:SAM-dependent methyltransferase
MDRRGKLLFGLNLRNTMGLEIGALDRPIATGAQGHVIYVDHADTDSLRRKYANDPNVNVAKIVNVDAVWGGQTLQECLGPGKKVDYIVASHVIEHVPDLIGWLEELRSILKPNGELRLAVPDRRFTFDFFRQETRLCDILHAYLVRARVPTPMTVLDHVLNACTVNYVDILRSGGETANVLTEDLVRDALQMARGALECGAYHDVHCWVLGTPRARP